jgi:pimeloyl-ACP methyl ester carboxylesterase
MNNLPVLILHGALGAASQLLPTASHLRTLGFEVHTLNFSGHGGEPFHNSFGIETFARDVQHFITSQPISRVYLFGYSMGGYVALWFAHRFPQHVGALVTLGTKFDWSPASAEAETKKLNPEKILEKVPAFARLLQQRHSPADWTELLSKTRTMMLELGHGPLLTRTVLASITHRTEIWLGDMDDMADRKYSEQVAHWLPRGSFRLLNHTAHPIEKFDLTYLNRLTDFFSHPE